MRGPVSAGWRVVAQAVEEQVEQPAGLVTLFGRSGDERHSAKAGHDVGGRDVAAEYCLGGAGFQQRADGIEQALPALRDHAAGQANHAVGALHRAFLATPYRPTGLSTAARTIVRLVDEVSWLNTIAVQSGPCGEGAVVSRPACAVKVAAAAVLERGADLLDVTGGHSDDLHAALAPPGVQGADWSASRAGDGTLATIAVPIG